MEALKPIGEFIQQNGLPALALIALALGVARVVSWIGNELIKPTMNDLIRPLFKRCTRAIDAIEGMFHRQSADIGEVRASLQRIEQRQHEQLRTCPGTAETRPLAPSGSALNPAT